MLALIGAMAACAQPAQRWPVPMPNGPMVVFDLDSALSKDGTPTRDARVGGAEVTQAFYKKGYTVLYLSTQDRPKGDSWSSWMAIRRFAPGSTYISLMPADQHDPAAFKARMLGTFLNQGRTLSYAYGVNSADFAVYAKAGIDPAHIYALVPAGSTDCQPGAYAQCLQSWVDHLLYVENQVPSMK